MGRRSAETTHTLKNGDLLHVVEKGEKAKLTLVGGNGSFARKLSSVTLGVLEAAINKGKLLIDGLTLCFKGKQKKVPK